MLQSATVVSSWGAESADDQVVLLSKSTAVWLLAYRLQELPTPAHELPGSGHAGFHGIMSGFAAATRAGIARPTGSRGRVHGQACRKQQNASLHHSTEIMVEMGI